MSRAVRWFSWRSTTIFERGTDKIIGLPTCCEKGPTAEHAWQSTKIPPALRLSLAGHRGSPALDRAAFRVARIYATLAADGRTADLKLTPDEQHFKCLMAPEAFAAVPGGWGAQGWTTAMLAALSTAELEAALEWPGVTQRPARQRSTKPAAVEGGDAVADPAEPGAWRIASSCRGPRARIADERHAKDSLLDRWSRDCVASGRLHRHLHRHGHATVPLQLVVSHRASPRSSRSTGAGRVAISAVVDRRHAWSTSKPIFPERGS